MDTHVRGVEEAEMMRVFNMGVGMIGIVDAAAADALVSQLRQAGESAWILGEVVGGEEIRLEHSS